MSDRVSGGGPDSTRPSGRRPAAPSRSELAAVQTAAKVPSPDARAAATTVAIAEEAAGSVEAIMAALPDPSSLPPGALVVVPSEVAGRSHSLARSVLAVFRRPKTVSRARRCTALVARGYVDVGSAADEDRADLAWGYAPSASAPDEA